MVTDQIKILIKQALVSLAMPVPEQVDLEHPADMAHGDYATNVALALAKTAGKNPKELAELLVEKLREFSISSVEKIEVAGPGFINFYLAADYWQSVIVSIGEKKDSYGRSGNLAGQKVIVEFTDPNPFKEFHIGHLMSNTIGESVARLIEATGAELKRACYQGDVGLHVAKAMWALVSEKLKAKDVKDLGTAYAVGAKAYEDNEEIKKEINELNKIIYDRSNEAINELYDSGRQLSLDYFETIYQKLGTKFDYYFFESKTGEFGKQVVEAGLEKGIFEKSDGAVVYKGEQDGLHTRVFINSEGLPTYEAKELGLAKIKYETYPYDLSVILTGNEINDYFRVLLAAMTKVFPELAAKTKHLGHGMLRLSTGKMSSRTGEVITAESLLSEVEEKVKEKTTAEPASLSQGGRGLSEADIKQVAVGAIKYMILKQNIGSDVIFDVEQSISLEGDSGAYIQYAYTRALSVLRKAEGLGRQLGHLVSGSSTPSVQVSNLERYLARFPEVVARAAEEHAPHYLATYLYQLASEFNNFYAHNKILDSGEAEAYRLALTAATAQVLKSGLSLLGIQAPERM